MKFWAVGVLLVASVFTVETQAGECANCRPYTPRQVFPVISLVPPKVVNVPKVTVVPYKYERTDNVLRRGPILRWLFGPLRQQHVYQEVK